MDIVLSYMHNVYSYSALAYKFDLRISYVDEKEIYGKRPWSHLRYCMFGVRRLEIVEMYIYSYVYGALYTASCATT